MLKQRLVEKQNPAVHILHEEKRDGVTDGEEERIRDSPPPSHSMSEVVKGSTRPVQMLPAHNTQ